MAMRDIGSHAPRLKAMGRPKALGNRRSGRAGEPAAGESLRASESLDDAPQDPRLPSYPPAGPTDRLRDPYGSLSTLLGIRASQRASNRPSGPQATSAVAIEPTRAVAPSAKLCKQFYGVGQSSEDPD